MLYPTPPVKPKIYTAKDHHIRENLIDQDALSVITRLQGAGHTAYLVGGGVRDLLLNREPKDFDISTSALPEEIKKLFGRSCVLIGRRFRLAHVRFGKKIIEVATFRAGSEGEELIVRDNIWGTPEEDALRRDFTFNGLFYDPSDHRIIDYVGGYKDLKKNYLCSIGKPVVRFKQDPVRMIRCLKFHARFGFKIDPACIKAIRECQDEILKSAPPRLLEEFLRMLESGASEPFFDTLHAHGLLKPLFPVIDEMLSGEIKQRVHAFLHAADEAIKSGLSFDRSTLAASLAYPLVEKVIEVNFKDKSPTLQDLHHICANTVHELFVEVHPRFTRRLCHNILFILDAQFRLTPITKRPVRLERLSKLAEFPLAIQFFRLRTLVDSELATSYEEWKRFEHIPYKAPIVRRRRRRR